MKHSDRQIKRLFKEALAGIVCVPDSVLSDAIEAVRMAGEQRGELEAYEHYMATRADPSDREQRLADQCRIVTAQMERLIRVNRYLFTLIEHSPHKKPGRTHDKPVDVFSRMPRL